MAGLLTDESVAAYVLGLNLDVFAGVAVDALSVESIGGGNLNFAWRCGTPEIGVFVKQAPEYIKCLGEAYALTARRAAFEAAALRAFGRIAPAHAPRVLSFDERRCVIVMEHLAGCRLLREDLMAGGADAAVAAQLGAFVAAVHDATRDSGAETFEGAFGADNNAAMVGITTAYVFTKPWDSEDETNRAFGDGFPALGARAAALRRDAAVLGGAAAAASAFATRRECLCHGDLHAGSVMTDGARTCAIDAEFAFYGPSGFDVALLLAGYVFAYAAATAWAVDENDAARRRGGLKAAIRALWASYAAARAEKRESLGDTFDDACRFLGAELTRRVLGAASVPDLADIADDAARQAAELLVLDVGAACLTAPPTDIDHLLARLDSAYDATAHATRA